MLQSMRLAEKDKTWTLQPACSLLSLKFAHMRMHFSFLSNPKDVVFFPFHTRVSFCATVRVCIYIYICKNSSEALWLERENVFVAHVQIYIYI